jgi:predicted DsbA family dithiol-disulfide isomerase
MKEAFVFVYHKGSKIKVLSAYESAKQDIELRFKGWKHTSTLDACKYIQYLAEENEDIFNDLIKE